MSHGGALPKTAPTGWVYLPSSNCTIRWRRGDKVAYVFDGQQMKTYPDEAPRVEVVATVPVSSRGWVDANDIKLAGEHWVKANHHKRCPKCGKVA